MRLVRLGLAGWAVAYVLSLWGRTERLREKAGIYYVYDAADEPIAREDGGGVGAWLNCPACAAVVAVPVAALIERLGLADNLAGLGLSLLAVRWWEAARPKARWWE